MTHNPPPETASNVVPFRQRRQILQGTPATKPPDFFSVMRKFAAAYFADEYAGEEEPCRQKTED